MSNRQETVNAMVLAQLCHYNASVAGQVYRLFGSATAAISNRHNLRDAMPEATDRLAQMLQADDSEARSASATMHRCCCSTKARPTSTAAAW